jgi:hypothetical protein
MYILAAALFSLVVGIFSPDVSHAYIWRCTTPQGYIWTEQPNPSGDCEEFDGKYNPNAAPPSGYNVPPQPAPQPQEAPPAVLPPPYAYAPYPYPYYPYPYAPYYYYPRTGLYFGVPYPFFGFQFRFGGHGGHGGHFRR